MYLEADQANAVYKYKSLKTKILKTDLNIRFIKKCLRHNVTPKFATINIRNTSIAASNTKIKVQKLWLKEEIKGLYKKKNYLNKLLFNAHLRVRDSIHPIIINEVLEVIDVYKRQPVNPWPAHLLG